MAQDLATVTARFLDAAGAQIGSVRVGPVTFDDRKRLTVLLKRTAQANLPPKTRSMAVVITVVADGNGAHHAYVDNISLTLGKATVVCGREADARRLLQGQEARRHGPTGEGLQGDLGHVPGQRQVRRDRQEGAVHGAGCDNGPGGPAQGHGAREGWWQDNRADEVDPPLRGLCVMLGALALVGGLILSAVFATAGITKLADLAGTRTAVREFGAPRAFVAPLALLLPLTELAVAFILLPGPTRVPGAAGALVLLGIFSAAIAVSLARGRTPDCHCFGQLHSAPASSMTLVRNAFLAGLAALALAAGLAGESTSAVAWLGGLNGVQLAVLTLGCVVAALTAAVTLAFLSLLRSYGKALLRLDTIERRLAQAGIELEER